VSEALYIPAGLALIADVHPGRTRSRAVGLHQMGIYLGVIVGGFGGYAADSAAGGWRWAFAACGVVGVLYAVPLFVLLGRPPRESAPVAVPRPSLGAALRELAGDRSFVLLVSYFTLPALAGWVVRDWMPAILKAEFGIGQGVAGVSATLYWQAAAIVGAVGGGWLADRWMRRTTRGRIYVSALGMTLIVPAMFGVGYAPATGALWVAVAFLALFGVGWGCFDANNMPILAQIVRPQLRATGYGLMNFVSVSVGGLADYGFGLLRDLRVPLFGIFSIFASTALLSIALVLLIRPRDVDSAPAASA
jgi:MFS family permease